MLFDTLDRAVELIRNTSTRTGLATTVNVIRRVYETGRNATTEMKQLIQRTMIRDDMLPKWNYGFAPQI